MTPESGTCNIVTGIEDVLAMLPTGQTIVDNECDHHIPRTGLAIGNVLGPTAGACSVARNALASVTPIASFMSKTSASLIRAMVLRRAGHSRRRGERSERLSIAQKANGFIHGRRALFRPEASVTGKDEDIAIHPSADPLNESGVKRRILAREVHLANYGAAGGASALRRILLVGEDVMGQQDDDQE